MLIGRFESVWQEIWNSILLALDDAKNNTLAEEIKSFTTE